MAWPTPLRGPNDEYICKSKTVAKIFIFMEQADLFEVNWIELKKAFPTDWNQNKLFSFWVKSLPLLTLKTLVLSTNGDSSVGSASVPKFVAYQEERG